MRPWLLAAALVLSAGCSDTSTSPTPPVPPTVSGTWATTVTFEGVAARMTWVLTQTNANVTGPVTVTLPTGSVLMNGFLTGTFVAPTLTYSIAVGPGGIPAKPTCVGQFGGTMTATTTTLVGPMKLTSSSCTVSIPLDTLTLTKQ